MTEVLHPWLVADIGGTNARFGLVRSPGAPVTDVLALKGADFATPEAAAHAYLERVAQGGAGPVRPQRVALALASAVDGDTVKLTNSPWTVSRRALTDAFAARQVLLLNDFESLSLALPGLGDEASGDVRYIGAPRPDRHRPMAVIGPGTGLGVSACVPTGHGWVALAAEGGHVTAAPADDFESEVLRVLRIEFRHVSAERVLSGIGLPLLHRAVSRVRGGPDETLAAEEITRRAREQGDPHCSATLDTFCAMLGGFAGNVALTIGARGGVFVAGGIVPRLGDDFLRSRFRERFEAKGRFDAYLARIATALLTAPHAALRGAAQALVQTPLG